MELEMPTTGKESQRNWNDASAWEEHIDPSHATYFYFHAGTGETMWEEPTLELRGGYRPSTWRIEHDASSGRVFFRHRESGEVVWELPMAGDGLNSSNPMHG